MNTTPDDFEPVLAEAIRRTGVEHYRYLTMEHPKPKVREQYRDLMRSIVASPVPEIGDAFGPVYPKLTTQIGNAMEAAKRFISAWWRGDETIVDKAEVARRLTICLICTKFDHSQNRCRLCGRFAKFKAKLATEHCPLPEEEGGPKW